MQQFSLKNGKILNIGSKIKEIRDSLKFTQSELADTIGVSKSLISRVEVGLIDSINHETIIKLNENLNISFKWLLLGEGEMIEAINVDDILNENNKLKDALISKQQEIDRLKNQVDILIRAISTK